jgi:hypothetical protein
MDSRSRTRIVGESGRVVISAGKRGEGRMRSRCPSASRFCASCRRTRLLRCSLGAVCGPCQRALSDWQHLADPDARDDLAARAQETEPMRSTLARLDFCAVLVIYRSAARLSRREPGGRTGLSESTIWYREAGERPGIYVVRQLLQFADSAQVPRPARLPVILGQPQALSDLTAVTAAAPSTGGADRG